MAYSFYPNPKATQYFIVQTHGRATGQDRGTGRGARTTDTLGFVLFFFKEKKYSLFQAYGNFQGTAVLRSLICEFVQSTRLFRWAQNLLPCRAQRLSSPKNDAKATHNRPSDRLNIKVLFIHVF